MKHPVHILLAATVFAVLPLVAAEAQAAPAPPAAGTAADPGMAADSDAAADPSLEELILAASADELLKWGEENVAVDRNLHHYNAEGYPEDVEGQLVLAEHEAGPMVYMENERRGRLLYAQFESAQRDGVFFARAGTISDPLPDGSAFEIPYGSGALKQNESILSLVEARVVPHFGDNRKIYTTFPLRDLYLGASVGSTGVTASVRFVQQETYVAYARIGINPFARLNASSVLNTYSVPLHLGGGYRFPGVFPEILGENLITVAADIFVGLGDRDGDPDTAAAVVLPGAAVELERLLYDTASSRENFREDPRPYNYRVNSFSIRLGAYLDVPTFVRGGNLVRVMVSAGAQFNIIGPRIPDHEFKTTEVRYVHEYYVEDLATQEARREAREQ